MKSNIESFLKYLTLEKNYSQKTIKSYAKDLEDFENFLAFKGISMENISKATLREYVYFLKLKKLRGSTLNRKISALRSFFNFFI